MLLQLQRQGVIEYSRGHITVLDRHKLEQLSCECYAVVKKEYDRLLPQQEPPATVSLRTVGMNPAEALAHRQRYR